MGYYIKDGIHVDEECVSFPACCQMDGLDFLAVTYGLLRFLRDLVRVSFSCKVSATSPVVLSRWTNKSRSR